MRKNFTSSSGLCYPRYFQVLETCFSKPVLQITIQQTFDQNFSLVHMHTLTLTLTFKWCLLSVFDILLMHYVDVFLLSHPFKHTVTSFIEFLDTVSQQHMLIAYTIILIILYVILYCVDHFCFLCSLAIG